MPEILPEYFPAKVVHLPAAFCISVKKANDAQKAMQLRLVRNAAKL